MLRKRCAKGRVISGRASMKGARHHRVPSQNGGDERRGDSATRFIGTENFRPDIHCWAHTVAAYTRLQHDGPFPPRGVRTTANHSAAEESTVNCGRNRICLPWGWNARHPVSLTNMDAHRLSG